MKGKVKFFVNEMNKFAAPFSSDFISLSRGYITTNLLTLPVTGGYIYILCSCSLKSNLLNREADVDAFA